MIPISTSTSTSILCKAWIPTRKSWGSAEMSTGRSEAKKIGSGRARGALWCFFKRNSLCADENEGNREKGLRLGNI